MKKNVQFEYVYRDASNYKSWGSLVFDNLEGMSVDQVEARLRKAFEEEQFFVAGQVRVPEVFLYTSGDLNEDDHCYHEMASVDVTEDDPDDSCKRSIKQFVEEVEQEAHYGWRAFDPQDKVG